MKKIVNKVKKNVTLSLVVLADLFVLVFGALFIVYYARFTSFIFFDEYANILAGTLLLSGNQLYSEQFFNHQMLPVYISAVIQYVFNPDSLYKLILYHRFFVFLVSGLAGAILVFKLRWVGLGVVVLYEFVKYYLFGYLFLAEGIIVYIHLYLFYLGWKKLQGNSISFFNLIYAAIGTWFIVWSREPYVLLAVFLYGYILLQKNIKREQLYSLGLLFILSFITFITVPIGEYLYQVVYVNYKTVFSYQIQSNQNSSLGLFSMFFYPVFIFLSGEMNTFRIFLMGVSTVFLVSLAYYLYRTKKYLHALFIIVALGLANVRMVQPGTIFYGAFYIIQWYAIVILVTFLLINANWKYNKKLSKVMCVVLGLSLGFLIFQKDSYVLGHVDRNHLFSFQYDKYYITGQTINILANSSDTLFVDLSDSLLFWQAQTPSAYKYVVYYPVMNDIPLYRTQRMEMFKTSPPSFYYTNCNEGNSLFSTLPKEIRHQYAPLLFNNEENCFYVLKERARSFTDEQLEKIALYRFSLSPQALQ